MRDLLGEAKTDDVAGASSRSSITRDAKGVSDSGSAGPHAVPARRRAIIVTGAGVVEGQGHAVGHLPQLHSCACGLCPGDAQTPSGRAAGKYHSCPRPI
jgi:hypothetical protein